jgi:energy-coupling factor transport system ATP-binding protein
VTGANASGKTTLGRLLTGLLKPIRGSLTVRGKRVVPATPSPYRGVGMIFQDPGETFVAPTLEEDVAFGLENRQVESGEIRRAVDSVLAMVGLKAFALRHPSSLSGGQKQLAALAGALAVRPEVLIMDEAAGYLDDEHRDLFRELVGELRRREGLTVIDITQEPEDMWMADRVLVLAGGGTAYLGPPGDLLRDPVECRRLKIEPDTLSELTCCLERHGLSVPPGRPDLKSLEEWLADRM